MGSRADSGSQRPLMLIGLDRRGASVNRAVFSCQRTPERRSGADRPIRSRPRLASCRTGRCVQYPLFSGRLRADGAGVEPAELAPDAVSNRPASPVAARPKAEGGGVEPLRQTHPGFQDQLPATERRPPRTRRTIDFGVDGAGRWGYLRPERPTQPACSAVTSPALACAALRCSPQRTQQ